MASERMPKKSLVASSPGVVQPKVFKHMVSRRPLSLRGEGRSGQVVFFLLKVAALETVRRLSRARCPFLWRALQALPVLGSRPFKWIQRWAPFRKMVEGVQIFSRPLLFLSIATAFSDQSENSKNPFGGVDDSQTHSESPSSPSNSDTRNNDESSSSIVSENWLLKLFEELETQGITLPERINVDELRRFYTAANGDFSCLLSSVKRTIRWRETYSILSLQELEAWSHLVFWHGLDVMHRPCLVIRLGLACSNLEPCDRPRFAQAVGFIQACLREWDNLHSVTLQWIPRIANKAANWLAREARVRDLVGIWACNVPNPVSLLVEEDLKRKLPTEIVDRLEKLNHRAFNLQSGDETTNGYGLNFCYTSCESCLFRARVRHVSQIEFGVLHLINEKDPQITVLMDCEDLSPFRFPMQVLRSCSTLVQDHYPNRLGTLFVIRLPPVVRVIAQTFIQVLKPTTRQKLRIEGEAYQKVLSEFLQSVPVFLGGDCTCSKCRALLIRKRRGRAEETSKSGEPCGDVSDEELALDAYPNAELPVSGNCDHVLRATIVSILMLWIFIAFLAGMHDPESLSSLPL